MDNQNKNTILAIALSVIVLIGWQVLYVNPRIETERKQAESQAQQPAAQTEATGGQGSGASSQSGSADIPTTQSQGAASVAAGAPGGIATTREAAIANSKRIPFENQHIIGSLNLQAARIDDLRLKDYHETIDKQSPRVTLLSPSGTPGGYFAEFGFAGSAESGDIPGPQSQWRVVIGETLGPDAPVVLEWENGQGVVYQRTISLDDTFLFTVEDEVTNNSGKAISISPYGRVTRFGKPATTGIYVLHEGLIGYFGEAGLQEVDYGDLEDTNILAPDPAAAGWLGITDKYWAAALIPEERFKPRFAHFTDGVARYQADYLGDAITIEPGSSKSVQNRLFAGAKKTEIIDSYEARYGIPKFDLMIDWGWFYWITKPLFKLMSFLYHLFGNFGLAILATTVVIKAILFPLANLSYASMAKMKKVQPQMQKIKEEAGDDRMKLQQEMMALYKKEKINPAAGCWPMLVQIPVFFALYKVIYVTIEMRHAPFFGWIQDLSAPDPTSVFNLFGLLPYDVPSFLLIGVWPLLMGATMFLQMQMNPAPPDPTQQMIFKWMPVVFTFMLATFPAGLVIYWAWNNFLSIIQQGIIMRRNGVKIELWDNLKSLLSRTSSDTPSK